MEELVLSTGQRGFHLVDEAAPPRLLRELALEILRRGLQVHFWGNIRFERSYTPDLCRLLAAAGLIAVTGGLEVASDRLLAKMDKGITVAQAARAASAFTDAGVLVHAYLMYGFPSQTVEETIDAMEVVRQFFTEGVLGSAFWHRFVLTRHSRVFAEPHAYGVHVDVPRNVFATNDLPHEDPIGADPDPFDVPLAESLAAWMRGDGLEHPVETWFGSREVQSTRVPAGYIRSLLNAADCAEDGGQRLVWVGDGVLETDDGVVLLCGDSEAVIQASADVVGWIMDTLDAADPGGQGCTLADVRSCFPGEWQVWKVQWQTLRRAGLLLV